MLEFRVLGPVEVVRDGNQLPLGTPKQRALLVALLLHANQVVPIERLVDLLWEAAPPPSATANIRTYATRLRSCLADRVVARSPGFLIDVQPGELDLAVFADLVTRARALAIRGGLVEAVQCLTAALHRWRGAAAADVRRNPAIGGLLAAVDEQHGAAVEELAQARLALGQHAELIPDLRRHLAVYPLRERLWGMLMTAQYRSRDAGAALATYGQARAVIADQLGLEPGPELVQLHRAVLDRDDAVLSTAPAGAVAPGVPPRELPPDTAIFVGRDAELDRVAAALRSPGAVVVVHGPGGSGKSALGLRSAYQVAERFPDGQLYADLHGATAGVRPAEPVAILGRFLRALGVPSDAVPDDAEELCARFRSLSAPRRLLVVLDNAIDEAQVRPLLPAGPGCAAILTSRYALTLPEASETLALGCLAPQAAVTLLGQLCGPERVAEQPGSAAELAQLCEHLPLAVRIAGARLASRPGRPLAALVAELRDERHRLDGLRFGDLAIRSCFHVNYQALAEHPGTPERAAARLFRRFGLIRAGSVGVPVAGALLDAGNLDAELALDRLVSARLLDEAGAGYAMHDLLRLFASEQLLGEPAADREQAVHRVLCHYLSTARRAADLLRPNEVRPGAGDFAEPVPRVVLATAADALAWLDAQWPNLMAAARQVAGSPPGLARFILGLSSAAAQYMPMRGRWGDVATLAALQLRVARRLGDVPAELTALVMLASVHRQRGEYDRALHCLDRSLRGRRELGDERAVASTLVHLGQTYAASGDLDRALRCLDEAADGFRRQGRRTSEGIARFEAGEVLLQAGAYDRALACLTESLDIRVGEADLVGAGITLVGLGKAHCRIGNDAQALRLLTDGLHRCREMGAQEYVWQALLWRGDLLRRTGHPERATADLVDALAICRAAGERRGSAYALRLLGLVWRDRGQPRRAAGCRQRAAAMLAGARPPDGPVAPDDDWPAPA